MRSHCVDQRLCHHNSPEAKNLTFSQLFARWLNERTRGKHNTIRSSFEKGAFVVVVVVTTVLSHWDFSHGKFGSLSPGKASATESRFPTYGACYSVSIILPNPDVDWWWLFFPRARILGECSTIHFPPALFFSFFLAEISSRILINSLAWISPQWLSELRRLWHL